MLPPSVCRLVGRRTFVAIVHAILGRSRSNVAPQRANRLRTRLWRRLVQRTLFRGQGKGKPTPVTFAFLRLRPTLPVAEARLNAHLWTAWHEFIRVEERQERDKDAIYRRRAPRS